MADTGSTGSGREVKTPVHLWIVGVAALLWNAMGAFDYLATQIELESYMGQFTEVQLEHFYSLPAWAVSAWALGVWGALLGTIGLLLRRKWSVWAYAVSLVGLLLSSIYNFGLSDGAESMGTGGVVFSAVIWVVAIFLFVYARSQAKKGVLS